MGTSVFRAGGPKLTLKDEAGNSIDVDVKDLNIEHKIDGPESFQPPSHHRPYVQPQRTVVVTATVQQPSSFAQMMRDGFMGAQEKVQVEWPNSWTEKPAGSGGKPYDPAMDPSVRHAREQSQSFDAALNGMLHAFYQASSPTAALDMAAAASSAMRLSRDATATLGMQALLVAILKDKEGDALSAAYSKIVFDGQGKHIADLAYFMADQMQEASGNKAVEEKAQQAAAQARPANASNPPWMVPPAKPTVKATARQFTWGHGASARVYSERQAYLRYDELRVKEQTGKATADDMSELVHLTKFVRQMRSP